MAAVLRDGVYTFKDEACSQAVGLQAKLLGCYLLPACVLSSIGQVCDSLLKATNTPIKKGCVSNHSAYCAVGLSAQGPGAN